MPRESFTVYTRNLEPTNIVNLDYSFTDGKGSATVLATTIIDLFNSPSEYPVLLGQNVVNIQYIYKSPIGIEYGLFGQTFFFENGSIKVDCNTFNWVPGTPIVGTIIYGTGHYLGATGFLEIDVLDYQLDACQNVSVTAKGTFIFTN